MAMTAKAMHNQKMDAFIAQFLTMSRLMHSAMIPAAIPTADRMMSKSITCHHQ